MAAVLQPLRRHPGLTVLGLIVVAVVAVIVLWDWNWFRPLAEARASALLGRPVTIGNLAVQLGWEPLVAADDIAIGNPPEFPAGSQTAHVDRVAARVELMDLLHGALVIPAVVVDHPVGDFHRGPSGTPNWAFKLAGGSSRTPPRLGGLVINQGNIHLADPTLRADVQLAVSTEAAPDGEPRLVVTGRGSYANQPITARFVGGSVLALRDPSKPYPVDLQLANGATRITLKGTVEQPLTLGGAQLALDLQGPDMAQLFPLTGVPFPETQAYHVSGALDYAAGKIRFRRFAGTVGSSDLEGDFAVDPGPERPVVTATLASRRVVLADLAAFIGSTPGKSGAPTETPRQKQERAAQEASPRLIPDLPLNLPKIKAADVHLSYKGARIESQSTPLDDLEARLAIDNGKITLDPLSFGVGQGRIVSTIALDARDGAVHAVADVDFRQVDVRRLMAATHTFGGAGTIGGRMRVDGTGRSLSEVLGSGNGELRLFMTGGDLSALLVDLAGLDLGNALTSALGLPTRTPVRCMVGDFGLAQGQLGIRTFLIDTTEANIVAKGGINLRDEKTDVQVTTDPKHPSIGSLAAPIDITGPLKSPGIKPDPGVLAARGGAAAVLGVLLTPLGALLPTIQLGLGEDSDCAGVVDRARAAVAEMQRAPPPPQAVHAPQSAAPPIGGGAAGTAAGAGAKERAPRATPRHQAPPATARPR